MQQYHSNGTDEWVTTRQAAEILRMQPRQIRNCISGGELEARTEGEGANKRYFVSRASIEELQRNRIEPQDYDESSLTAQEQDATMLVRELVRELTGELGKVRYRLGQAEARLEMTVRAEDALREQLQRERERADRLEAERERLFPDLLRERDRANAERERAEHFEEELRQVLEIRRGWFRRFFGF